MYTMQAPASDYIKAAANTVLCIHRAEVPGDILVFVATASEVQQCLDIMHDAMQGMAMRSLSVRLQPLALHGGACPPLATSSRMAITCCILDVVALLLADEAVSGKRGHQASS